MALVGVDSVGGLSGLSEGGESLDAQWENVNSGASTARYPLNPASVLLELRKRWRGPSQC